jgi:hypothetical protein
MNQIYVIHPFLRSKSSNVWVFDDEARGLKEEPFVCGASEFISAMLPRTETDCTITFSADPFPGADKLDILVLEMGGAIYGHPPTRKTLWLCPALLRYFASPPQFIYFKITPFIPV